VSFEVQEVVLGAAEEDRPRRRSSGDDDRERLLPLLGDGGDLVSLRRWLPRRPSIDCVDPRSSTLGKWSLGASLFEFDPEPLDLRLLFLSRSLPMFGAGGWGL
jgi:hypothetical protein